MPQAIRPVNMFAYLGLAWRAKALLPPPPAREAATLCGCLSAFNKPTALHAPRKSNLFGELLAARKRCCAGGFVIYYSK